MQPEKTPFQDMLESATHAMVAVDRAGVIRFVNHQAELIGQPIEMLVPVAVRHAHRESREGHAAGVGLRVIRPIG